MVGRVKHRTFTSENRVSVPCESFPKPNHLQLSLHNEELLVTSQVPSLSILPANEVVADLVKMCILFTTCMIPYCLCLFRNIWAATMSQNVSYYLGLMSHDNIEQNKVVVNHRFPSFNLDPSKVT